MMDEEIIDIDNCLSDSFCQPSDQYWDDVNNIVEQWMQPPYVTTHSNEQKPNSHLMETNSGKFVDTRTFTRPKKKFSQNLESTFNARSSFGTGSGSADKQPSINLQIGGLVTTSTMEKSYLGDVSPPSSMLSSIDRSMDRMNDSLITSMDFANVSSFMDNQNDALTKSTLNEYDLASVISDREFLDTLTNSDDNEFVKDSGISSTDVNPIKRYNLSGNSTLQNSTESNYSTSANDTLTLPAVPQPAFVNSTFINNEKESIPQPAPNETFDLIGNYTFGETNKISNTTVDIKDKSLISKTFDCNVEPLRPLHSETFDKLENQLNNITIEMNKSYNIKTGLNDSYHFTPESAEPDSTATINNVDPSQEANDTHIVDLIRRQSQSTPVNSKSIRRSSITNISPILNCDEHKTRFDRLVSRISELDEDEGVNLRKSYGSSNASNNNNGSVLASDVRDDRERESLQNFEEFEKSMSMLENGKNEEEFDELLNNFANQSRNARNQSDKMKQSLDQIKKRHSFINMEKQQENRMLQQHQGSVIADATFVDSNKLNESMNKSAMFSSSGSGERLLKRGRLFDGVSPHSSFTQPQTSDDEQCASELSQNQCSRDESVSQQQNEQISNKVEGSQLNEEPPFDKSNRDRFKTFKPIRLSRAECSENVEPPVDKSNRDRFKTIRIFKKPPENATMVPDVAPVEQETSSHIFASKNTNSPIVIETIPTIKSNSETKLQQPRRQLARPQYLSGIAKRDLSLKASSAECLDNRNAMQQNRFGAARPETVNSAKSPMGVKSKSIHNLIGGSGGGSASSNYGVSGTKSRMSYQPLKLYNPNETITKTTPTFKVPQPTQAPSVNLRQNAVKRMGLVRPSSGYFSYNVKRNDSDTESGRFSPTNSLSSGSSKGSLVKQEIETNGIGNQNYELTSSSSSNSSQQTFVNGYSHTVESNMNATIVKPVTTSIPKRSGLRQPMNIKKSGLPRPSVGNR